MIASQLEKPHLFFPPISGFLAHINFRKAHTCWSERFCHRTLVTFDEVIASSHRRLAFSPMRHELRTRYSQSCDEKRRVHREIRSQFPACTVDVCRLKFVVQFLVCCFLLWFVGLWLQLFDGSSLDIFWQQKTAKTLGSSKIFHPLRSWVQTDRVITCQRCISCFNKKCRQWSGDDDSWR